MNRWLIILIFSTGCVGGKPLVVRAESEKGPPGNVLNPNSNADDVLGALRDDGKLVHSFTADVSDEEVETIQGTTLTRTGKMWFVIAPNGEATMHLILDHKKVGDKVVEEKVEYLLDKGWLTIRTFDTKNETRIQLVPAGQKINLFDLGKGPFPFPIGQNPDDVHKQFDVTIPPPDKDNPDPPGTIHLLLKPKAGTPLDQQFTSIDVWVDVKTKMPAQVMTVNKRQTEIKTWTLPNLKLNAAVKDGDLTLPPLPPKWRSEDKPLAQ
jgi:hypothetical protein